MRLLKVTAAYLIARDLRRNCEDGHTAAMAIEKSVDEMKIPWAATAGAHGDLTCKMGFGSGGKRCDFFMPHVHPVNLLAFPDDVGEPIQ
jgi:hypothetical protein